MTSAGFYHVDAIALEDIKDQLNFHFQRIGDRLDAIEGRRTVYRREFEYKDLPRNDNRPWVEDGDWFRTANTEATTLLDLEGGFNGHRIWVQINDVYTTVDFENGNIRERTGTLTSWDAQDTQLMEAIYFNGLWYCEIWDFVITTDSGDPGGGGSSTRWQFTDVSTSYTPIASDAFKCIRVNSSSAANVTFDAGVFQKGDQVTVYQKGAGQVTIVAGTGVTINTPTNLTVNEQYGTVTLICETEDGDEFLIAGRMTP